MAACGSLQHIFEKPLPENPTLLESLSPWKQIKSVKPKVEDSSYTELFGELHFKENHVESSSSSAFAQTPSSSVSSSPLFAEIHPQSGIEGLEKEKNDSPNKNERSKSPTESYYPISHGKQNRHSDSFSSMNSESLSLCTEGLGFESSDDVEELRNDQASFDFQQHQEERISISRHAQSENPGKESKRSRTSKGSFPPPISCIGRTGKPWVCFKSYRQDGRFILQEIRIPTQEFLHACREEGRLRLQFIQSDDEILEGDEEEEEEEEEEEDDYTEYIEEIHAEKCADADVDHDRDCDHNHDHDKNEDSDEDDADRISVQIFNNNVEGSSE